MCIIILDKILQGLQILGIYLKPKLDLQNPSYLSLGLVSHLS